MVRIHHAPGVTGAFTDDDLGTFAIDGGVIEVDDAETAAALVDRHRRLSWADGPPESDANPGVEADDHPSNDDGEPLCTGKADGQCSRTVDDPGGTCWQHE